MSGETIKVDESNFEEKVLKSSSPVLVDFWASWCGPCVAIAPVLDELAADYKGKVVVAKMSVEENEHTPATYGVRSIPYLALFKDGKVVGSLTGKLPKAKMAELLDSHLD